MQFHVIAAPKAFGEGVVLNLQLCNLRGGGRTSWFTLDYHKRTLGQECITNVGKEAPDSPEDTKQPVTVTGLHDRVEALKMS